MEEKLIALLQNAGREDLAVALERDEELDDFIAKHSDELKTIPGFIDLMQPATSSAPHGLSKEDAKEFFTDINGNVDKRAYDDYFKQEAKYNSELAKRQQIADEYQRAKNMSTARKYLGNEYANKKAIQGKEGEALANEIAAKAAFITDFTTPPVSLIGPAIRYAQRGLNEDKWNPLNAETLFDVGTSFMGPAKGYAKTGYESVKRLAGPTLGKLFNFKPLKSVERSIDALDAAELTKTLQFDRFVERMKLTDLTEKYKSGELNHLQMLEIADQVEKDYPKLAEAIRDKVNLDASKQEASDLLDHFKNEYDNFKKQKLNTKDSKNEMSKYQAKYRTIEKKQPAMNEKVDIEFNEANDLADKKLKATMLLDDKGNLTNPVYDIANTYKNFKHLQTSPKLGKAVMKMSRPALKASGNVYNNDAYEVSDKEYNSAIEYIIQANRRQWNAGFKPRGGIELEAYNIAKQRGEI